MRETGDWALWSRELARKIAEGGEQYLIDKAKLVAWQDDDGESSETFRLLRHGDKNIDPLSFFYTLLSGSTPRIGFSRAGKRTIDAFRNTLEYGPKLRFARSVAIPRRRRTDWLPMQDAHPIRSRSATCGANRPDGLARLAIRA